MSGSTGHITSNRNNRALQRSGRKSFFKKYKLAHSGRRRQVGSVELSKIQKRQANKIRSKRTYFQLGIIFVLFVSLWWYVFNW